MASLYELSAGYASLIDDYDSADTDEEREDILAMLAIAVDDIADKAEAYAKIIKIKETEKASFKAEIDRLTKHYRADDNMITRLKSAIYDAMTLTGQTEVKTSIGKWRVQLNPPSCEVVNVDMVPKVYHIPQPDKVDKKAILDAFKQTGEIPSGVEIKREEGVRFR